MKKFYLVKEKDHDKKVLYIENESFILTSKSFIQKRNK